MQPYQGLQSFSNGSNHLEDVCALKRAKSRHLRIENLEDILVLVPVKYVTRLKSLGKSLFSLTSSPKFLKVYERVHSMPRLLTLRTYNNNSNMCPHMMLNI